MISGATEECYSGTIKSEKVFQNVGGKNSVWKRIQKQTGMRLIVHILRPESSDESNLGGGVGGKRYNGTPRLRKTYSKHYTICKTHAEVERKAEDRADFLTARSDGILC